MEQVASAISAVTPDGKLYTMIRDTSFAEPAIIDFLKHLLRHTPRKLLVVLDRISAHRSRVIKDFWILEAPSA